MFEVNPYHIIFFLCLPAIAILFEGIHRKLIARFQNRIGPPIWQPFYDLRKLLQKSKLDNKNDPFFNHAPLLYFIATYALFAMIPFSIVAFEFDFIFLIYLTILGSAFYILAGISSDSPYGIVGSMREMILMICYEITLAIVIITFIIHAGVLSLSSLNPSLSVLVLPLASFCLIVVAVIELKITPFDTAEAETEILPSFEVEYSGKNLFFMEFTKYMKRLFYVLLIPLLLFGLGNPFLYIGVGLITLFGLSLCQATTPRYRLDRAFMWIAIIMVIALIEFARVSLGLVWAF